MARINENYIWPLFGIAIFSVLIAFYVDDRRKLLTERTDQTQASNGSETDPHSATSTKSAKNTNSKNSYASTKSSSVETKQGGSSANTNSEFTGTIEEYLTKYGDKEKTVDASTKKSKPTKDTKPVSTEQNKSQHNSDSANGNNSSSSMDNYSVESSQANKKEHQLRNEKLQTSAKQHSAFSGSIEDYLASFSQQTGNETITENKSSSTSDTSNKTAKATHKHKQCKHKQCKHKHKHKHKHKKDALTKENYSGSIDGYLNKYDGGAKDLLKKGKNKSLPKHKPLGKHDGFHGSYEEYARLYNQ